MIAGNDNHTVTDFNPQPAWAEAWRLWTVFFPRRSITGRLVDGQVWRRHDGLPSQRNSLSTQGITSRDVGCTSGRAVTRNARLPGNALRTAVANICSAAAVNREPLTSSMRLKVVAQSMTALEA
jgi:hypothetical protein